MVVNTVKEFNYLVKPKNIDKFELENGICLVYTHFTSGFVDKSGALDSAFKKNIDYLSERDGGFYAISKNRINYYKKSGRTQSQ